MLNSKETLIKFTLKAKDGVELSFEGENLEETQVSDLIRKVIQPNFNHLTVIEEIDILKELEKAEPIKYPTVEKRPPVVTSKKLPIVDREEKEEVVYQTKEEDGSNLGSFNVLKELYKDTAGFLSIPNVSEGEGEEPAVEEKDRTEDFMKTGIKYKGINSDRPTYRCGYYCSKCTHSGRHYIPPAVKAISCHNCQTKLLVEPATNNGFGFGDKYRDKDGNFFYANVIDVNAPTYERS